MWRYLLATFLVLAGWFLLPVPFVALAAPFLRGTPWFDIFALLFPFLTGFLLIMVLVKLLLGRPW